MASEQPATPNKSITQGSLGKGAVFACDVKDRTLERRPLDADGKRSRGRLGRGLRARLRVGVGAMQPTQEYWFDHEKLEVYREAIGFAGWLSVILEGTV